MNEFIYINTNMKNVINYLMILGFMYFVNFIMIIQSYTEEWYYEYF